MAQENYTLSATFSLLATFVLLLRQPLAVWVVYQPRIGDGWVSPGYHAPLMLLDMDTLFGCHSRSGDLDLIWWDERLRFDCACSKVIPAHLPHSDPTVLPRSQVCRNPTPQINPCVRVAISSQSFLVNSSNCCITNKAVPNFCNYKKNQTLRLVLSMRLCKLASLQFTVLWQLWKVWPLWFFCSVSRSLRVVIPVHFSTCTR